jgi:23S rRNA (guanosine2251-2'-O)-methyltransferase
MPATSSLRLSPIASKQSRASCIIRREWCCRSTAYISRLIVATPRIIREVSEPMPPELVYGRHAVFQLLSAGRRKVHRLHLLKSAVKTSGDREELQKLARDKGITVSQQESGFFVSRFGPQATHQGIAVEADPYPYEPLEKVLLAETILILDEIQDPQNLGALCRSAHVFGVGGVILPETNAASVGPGACHASVGAVEHLAIARVSSIAKCFPLLKEAGFWIYGADHDAEKTLYEEAFPKKVALVVGNEERGLRRLVKEECDIRIRIPAMHEKVDSLNASVAGAVILSEILRQRLQNFNKTDRSN